MTAAQSNARAGLLRIEERTDANNRLLAASFLKFSTISDQSLRSPMRLSPSQSREAPRGFQLRLRGFDAANNAYATYSFTYRGADVRSWG